MGNAALVNMCSFNIMVNGHLSKQGIRWPVSQKKQSKTRRTVAMTTVMPLVLFYLD